MGESQDRSEFGSKELISAELSKLRPRARGNDHLALAAIDAALTELPDDKAVVEFLTTITTVGSVLLTKLGVEETNRFAPNAEFDTNDRDVSYSRGPDGGGRKLEDDSRVDTSNDYNELVSKLGPDRCRALLPAILSHPGVSVAIDEANLGLGTAVRQMLTEGAASLTRDELRKLQTFAANRLKEDDIDWRLDASMKELIAVLKHRAIEAVGFQADLQDAFNAVALASHAQVFGLRVKELNLQAVNDWLAAHAGAELEEQRQRDLVASLRFLQEQWNCEISYFEQGQNGVDCNILVTPMNRGATQGLQFRVRSKGRDGKNLYTRKTLPQLELRPEK